MERQLRLVFSCHCSWGSIAKLLVLLAVPLVLVASGLLAIGALAGPGWAAVSIGGASGISIAVSWIRKLRHRTHAELSPDRR
ncbi:hypothetical protein K7711_36470 [Nocardia sp. CA2R105]|uniref:hypothetical protein n=1 Tax=Nocardia coffeae TaxID=2873381 RepID=UPI001CA629D3|nr:hypothetical protein [Nocardia coffeae]MBY8862019.1 hypothetical protein [Nocardia coffeae]